MYCTLNFSTQERASSTVASQYTRTSHTYVCTDRHAFLLTEEAGDAHAAMGCGCLLSCLERQWPVDMGLLLSGEGRDMGSLVLGLW